MNDNAALIKRAGEGDNEAQNELVENNMGLVYSIVKRYTGRGYDLEDLVQIGGYTAAAHSLVECTRKVAAGKESADNAERAFLSY